MQRIILFTTLLFLITIHTAKAQVLQNDENIITIGLGLAAIPHNYYEQKHPSFTLSYQKGVTDKIGVGYISAGGLMSFTSSQYDYLNKSNKFTVNNNYTTIAAQGAYHFDMVDLTHNMMWNNVDVYAGMILGVILDVAINTEDLNKQRKTYFATDVFVGARYNFYENIGAFMEFGYGVAYIKGGLSIKF